MTHNPDESRAVGARPSRRFLPLAVLLLGTLAFFAFGLHDRISCAWLGDHHEGLTAFIAAHRVTAVIVYMAGYAVAVALSLPISLILTLAGGFLFGLWDATLYVVMAATLGATVLFLAARSAMGQGLRGRAGPAVARMEKGFRENAMSYLLFLRLTPVFPFWLVNLVAAVVGIPVRTFVLATFLGIIPASFVYASAGHGLGALFESEQSCDPRVLLSARVVLPLVGLALLALVPVFYKKLRGNPPEKDKAHE
jgi:uncharacterized membrane protein YdjX (TVP38/TMEM64 family)